MVETPADRAAFLADWGEDGFIDDQPVRVIYSAPYNVEPVGLAGQLGAEPRVLLPAACMPPRGEGDPVVDLPDRDPVRYLAREIHPDGTGWVTLLLSRHPVQP